MEDFNDELDKALKEFNTFTQSPEVIVFKNPVLNALFNGSEDKGGLPRGSVTQIAAESGAGKSTLSLVVARELCEQGLRVLYIDAEKGLNINLLTTTHMMEHIKGGNNSTNRFTVVQECDCDRVNTLIQKVAASNLVDFIILDSLGSLNANIYGLGGVDANNPKVGGNAKSIKIIMLTINKIALENKIGFICINHTAKSIGTYIPVEKPVGGDSTIYLSDIVIILNKKSSDFEKMNLGQKVEFKATKSRFGRGKSKVPFYIRFGQGIALLPTIREVLDKIEVDGKPILEIRGGGNGSLFIEGEEYKFRGENQLMDLIKQHYNYIKGLVDWRFFLPEIPKVPDYYTEEPDLFNEEQPFSSDLPKELQHLEVIEKEGNLSYLVKGVDSTGQAYHIAYNNKDELLILNYDSSDVQIKANPKKRDFDKQKAKLDEYLSTLQ